MAETGAPLTLKKGLENWFRRLFMEKHMEVRKTIFMLLRNQQISEFAALFPNTLEKALHVAVLHTSQQAELVGASQSVKIAEASISSIDASLKEATNLQFGSECEGAEPRTMSHCDFIVRSGLPELTAMRLASIATPTCDLDRHVMLSATDKSTWQVVKMI
jgi:hypothetical protein